MIATFGQLHLILPAATTLQFDAHLLALDQRFLRYEPAVAWDAAVSTSVTEWLSLFYLSYFVVLVAHAFALLAFERRGRTLAEFSLGIVTTFCVGHTLYVLVPAYGPWEHLAGTFQHPLDGAFWYPLMRGIVASGGARADVFASLHTAAPAFITMFSFRHRREWPYRYTWPVVAFVTTQIIIATMYQRWHYPIDVLAGLALAASVTALSAKAGGWEDASRARRGLPRVW